MLLVFDLRATPGGRPTSDGLLAALDPLTAMNGIAVDSIHWIYDVGDEPARTLVVLSLDPLASGHAIDARGGGSAGADRVVMLTLARATALLAPHGLRTRFVDASAAAPALSGLGDRRLGETARLGEHPSPPTAREHRREMVLNGRWCRAQRLDPTDVRRLWRSGSAARLAADVRRLIQARAPGARITATVWIRAGPDGMRHGGSVRLTARDRRDLDDLTADLDRAARRQGIRISPLVADQQPHLVGSLLSRPG
ncbi:MAG: type VII secretion protein EccE [Nakamurella sp.]